MGCVAAIFVVFVAWLLLFHIGWFFFWCGSLFIIASFYVRGMGGQYIFWFCWVPSLIFWLATGCYNVPMPDEAKYKTTDEQHEALSHRQREIEWAEQNAKAVEAKLKRDAEEKAEAERLKKEEEENKGLAERENKRIQEEQIEFYKRLGIPYP